MRYGKHKGLVIMIVAGMIIGIIFFLKLFPMRTSTLKVLYPQSLEQPLQVLLDSYSESIPNIELQKIPYSGELTEQTLQDADLVLLENPANMATADWTKIFRPVDEFLSSRAESMVLLPQKESPSYMVPLSGEIPVALYNKEVFMQVGIACPENINDLFKVCCALQLEEIVPLAVRVDDAGQWDLIGLTDSILTNVIHDTSNTTDLEGKTDWSSNSLEFVAGVLNDKILPVEKSETAAWMPGLLKGNYAIVLGSSIDAAAIEDTSVLGCFTLFGLGTNDYIAWHTSLAAAVNQKSRCAGEAEALIEYLLSPESQEKLNQETKQLPVMQNCEVLEGQRDAYRAMSQHRKAVPSFLHGLSAEERNVYLSKINQLFQHRAD